MGLRLLALPFRLAAPAARGDARAYMTVLRVALGLDRPRTKLPEDPQG
jgi:hypothetical protein